ncbi:MAG: radical SAM protein [Candidatus Omnitrophica bacterium]|nr:radical SAM protein [Candidatus Omnitrophota bacterium]
MIRVKQSDDFYSDLYSRARKGRFPLKVLFELTYSCNFKCVHCYNVKEKKKEIGTSQVKDILGQLVRAGCFHVGFTGGEPLTRPDVFEILEFAKSLGFRITLLTNGAFIDRIAADKIVSLGRSLNKVDISFLGAEKNTFESITQVPESFNKVKRAIKLLRKRDVDVMIKYTLMRQNKDEFSRIKEMADSFGCMFRASPTVNPKTDGSAGPLKYCLSPEEVISVFQPGKKLIRKNKKVLSPPVGKRLFRCGAGVSEASINPYGELKLCPEINKPVYPILKLKSSLIDAWTDLKEFVKKLEASTYLCKKCSLSGFCNSCPARMVGQENWQQACNQYDKELAVLRAKASPDWETIKKRLLEEGVSF